MSPKSGLHGLDLIDAQYILRLLGGSTGIEAFKAERAGDKPVSNSEVIETSLIVTGASGRVGRALRAVWGGRVAGLPVLWSARKAGQDIDLVWNIGIEPAPPLPRRAIFLHLAGQTRGSEAELAENRRSAKALGACARAADARHVFFMSSVAVYPPGPGLIAEDQAVDPTSAYAKAKLAAEVAIRLAVPEGRLTLLRLGNLAGADTLLTSARAAILQQCPVALDPVAGQPGGPERSYIGPQALAHVLAALIGMAAQGMALPDVLNLAQPPALRMADLLTAAGANWHFGPPRAGVIRRVAVDVARLAALVSLPQATAETVIADLNGLKDVWP